VSSAPADLEIARFAVGEIVEGTKTGWDAGTLRVSLPELAVGGPERALAEATVDIVRPGDPVRIANVLDAVIPWADAGDPPATFPGALGPLTTAGRGRRSALDDVGVIVACDWGAAGYVGPDEFPPSYIDMAGPAAQRTSWGRTTNVVISCVPAAGVPVVEADRAVRRTGLRLARDLAALTVGHDPDRMDPLRTIRPCESDDLPAVCVVLQVASEGPLLDTYLYGAPMGGLTPTLLDPLELIDGALINGTYDWAAVRNSTAAYQMGTLVRELLSAHGERLRFAGLIVALGYLDTADDKQRSAIESARLARMLGSEAAICTTFSSGNSHTDTMLTVRALEQLGIRTCALVAETNGGLTDHVPEADCLVSTGNEDELLEPWTPDRVICGGALAADGKPMPLWAYLGATGQTGDLDTTAVSA
jgi:glycine reductase complex component B subunit alpha and beta